MYDKIKIRRIRALSLLKLLSIGYLLTIIPFSILAALLSFVGAGSLEFNDQKFTGILALLVSPLIGIFITIMFTLSSWFLIYIGLLIYSKFRPIEIQYVVEKEEVF